MAAESWARVGLLCLHLMFVVPALFLVLKTDLRVLRRCVSAQTMRRVHRRLVWLLWGLWASGGAIVLVDVGGDLTLLLERPKLLAKLACVVALTANAAVLRHYALPRITARRLLGHAEARWLAVVGAVSTASWLMAAFLGLARPMASWSVPQALGLYGLVLAGAITVALLVCPGRLRRRQIGSGHTAVEEAAQTLGVPRATGSA
jgi:hypothetical protein